MVVVGVVWLAVVSLVLCGNFCVLHLNHVIWYVLVPVSLYNYLRSYSGSPHCSHNHVPHAQATTQGSSDYQLIAVRSKADKISEEGSKVPRWVRVSYACIVMYVYQSLFFLVRYSFCGW